MILGGSGGLLRRHYRRYSGVNLMPRRKPLGWPRYMVERKLKSGTTAYYWVIPHMGQAKWVPPRR